MLGLMDLFPFSFGRYTVLKVVQFMRAQPRCQVFLWFNTTSNFKTLSRTICSMRLSHILVPRLFSSQCILQDIFTNILIWHKESSDPVSPTFVPPYFSPHLLCAIEKVQNAKCIHKQNYKIPNVLINHKYGIDS